MTTLRRMILLLIQLIVRITSADQLCSICGDGFQVGKPNAVVILFEQLEPMPCFHLQEAGSQGLISSAQCDLLPSLISRSCGCVESKTASIRRLQHANPVSGSIYASMPVSVAAPVLPPVLTPVLPQTKLPTPKTSPSKQFCSVCGEGKFMTKQTAYITFANVTFDGTCASIRFGTPAECAYYIETDVRRARIAEICGCMFPDGPPAPLASYTPQPHYDTPPVTSGFYIPSNPYPIAAPWQGNSGNQGNPTAPFGIYAPWTFYPTELPRYDYNSYSPTASGGSFNSIIILFVFLAFLLQCICLMLFSVTKRLPQFVNPEQTGPALAAGTILASAPDALHAPTFTSVANGDDILSNEDAMMLRCLVLDSLFPLQKKVNNIQPQSCYNGSRCFCALLMTLLLDRSRMRGRKLKWSSLPSVHVPGSTMKNPNST